MLEVQKESGQRQSRTRLGSQGRPVMPYPALHLPDPASQSLHLPTCKVGTALEGWLEGRARHSPCLQVPH